MQIIVKLPKGKTINLDVMPEDTIDTIKAKVNEKEGIPPRQQRLIYSKIKLEDRNNLKSYKIQHGSTLNLDECMQISVRTPRGRTIELEVLPEDTIDTIKAKIQEKEGIPPKLQRLKLSKIRLENGRDLATYNIQDGSTLDLSKSMQIFVKTPKGKTITLDVMPEDTVESVKAEIQAIEGTKPHLQHLFFSRQKLEENGKSLSNYNIQDGTTLDLRKGIRITVKTLRGDSIFLDVLPDDSIDTIKAKI